MPFPQMGGFIHFTLSLRQPPAIFWLTLRAVMLMMNRQCEREEDWFIRVVPITRLVSPRNS